MMDSTSAQFSQIHRGPVCAFKKTVKRAASLRQKTCFRRGNGSFHPTAEMLAENQRPRLHHHSYPNQTMSSEEATPTTEETTPAPAEEPKTEDPPKEEEEAAAPAGDEDKVKEEESTATFEPVVSAYGGG